MAKLLRVLNLTNGRNRTNRSTGATASELLIKLIRIYHGRVLAGGGPVNSNVRLLYSMLEKMKTVLSLVLVGIIVSGAAFEVSAQRFPANYPIHRKTIKFQRGRTTTIVRGIARTPGIYEYHLHARAGQRVTVHLTSSNKGVELSIYDPSDQNLDGALGVYDWEGTLETSGDYNITLINNRSRVAQNPSFVLEVTIR